MFAVQEEMDGQIPIACAGYVGHQDLKACPADTLMAMNLFLLNLQMMDKWRPSEISEKELQIMMEEAPRRQIRYRGEGHNTCGPFVMPISVDGVWIYQPVLVLEDGDFGEGLVLGESFMQSMGVAPIIEQGVIQRDTRSSTMTRLKNDDKETSARALLDAGAGPNVMALGIWQTLGRPELLPQAKKFLNADNSLIQEQGRTKPILLEFPGRMETEPIQTYVSFVVIEARGQENIILGREFMLETSVVVDVTEKEARIEKCHNQVMEIPELSELGGLMLLQPLDLMPAQTQVCLLKSDDHSSGEVYVEALDLAGNACKLMASLCTMEDDRVWVPIVNSGRHRVQMDAGNVFGRSYMIQPQVVEEIAEVNEQDLEASDRTYESETSSGEEENVEQEEDLDKRLHYYAKAWL